MKKLLSIILTVMLLLSVCPLRLFSITANAATATSRTTGECTWELDGTTLTISGKGKMEDYYPLEYYHPGEDYNPSPWSTKITELIIKDGVTKIGKYAFWGCKKLKSITIGKGVQKIGNSAFFRCSGLKSITIPNSVTSIRWYAFDGCNKNLTIYGKRGSYAHRYAVEEGKQFFEVKLSSTSYTYNGKAKKPTVTVKNINGKKLKKGKDYTVTYAKGRKEVGKYSVKIKFKGNYSGSKTLYFTVNPKGTTVKSVSSAKKSLTVKWNKQITKTTGYQIQYSTSKKFTSAKTKTITNNKTTSYKLKSLKSKKNYYVRIRTFKTVKGKKIYSGWSSYKSKKTK